jgi:predicted TIM-barrel fold metal-dependent hydrolase
MSRKTKPEYSFPYVWRQVKVFRDLDGIQYAIIDTHTHSFNEQIKGSKMWAWSIPWEGTSDELIAHMDMAGVEKAVVLAYNQVEELEKISQYFGTIEDARRMNNQIAKAVGKHPERLIGFAKIPPTNNEEALIELERAVKTLGLKGLGHFQLQDYVTRYHEYPILEKAKSLKIPIEAGSDALYGVLGDIAPSFPEVIFKVSNFCFHRLHIDEVVKKCAKVLDNPNVYADVAVTLTFQPERCIETMKKIGFDKFVYGSDFPTVDYPIEHDINLVETYHRAINKIQEEDLKKFFWDNAAKILGIS